MLGDMGRIPQIGPSLHSTTTKRFLWIIYWVLTVVPEPGSQGWLKAGLICLSPQRLQGSFPEEYLKTLLCLKKLRSR